MAMKQVGNKEDTKICPRCGAAELLYIEGSLTKWVTCPKCRFKKLMEKDERGAIVVTPLLK